MASPGQGRKWTVSIALPGSVLANAQTDELRSYLAGQIARAAAIFCVDEIVVFSDGGTDNLRDETEGAQVGYSGRRQQEPDPKDTDLLLARLLSYLETPQYLRRHLFGMHEDLRYAGVLNPVDATHHLRLREVLRWREGVVVPGQYDRNHEQQGDHRQEQSSDMVDVGFPSAVKIPEKLPAGTRVTIDLGSLAQRPPSKRLTYRSAKVVSPDTPRVEAGLYWGYRVRLVGTLSSVFHGSELGSYDFVIGTSERGRRVDSPEIVQKVRASAGAGRLQHLLIVFGGVQGLESSAGGDERLIARGCGTSWTVAELFDIYVNTCPNQGSRTIRTEEAILISLATLRPMLEKALNDAVSAEVSR